MLEKIDESLPRDSKLTMELDNEIMDYCTAACRYYFKKGVEAGVTNLNFLKDTNIVEYM